MKKERHSYERILLLLILVPLLLPNLFAAEKYHTLLPPEILDKIIAHTSGDIAFQHLRRIALHNRLAASDAYYRAAEYVLGELKKYGIENARIEAYPADGKTFYYMFQSFYGWDGHFGELWLEEPYRERIADFEGMPACLLRWSQSADVKGELIFVGNGTSQKDYEGKDVRGKIVLTTGSAGPVHREAVFNRGALGVVSYWFPRPLDYPDVVMRDGIRPYETEDGRKATFGFKISHRRGLELKKMLDEGKKLVVSAKVKADPRPSQYHNVIAEIPGTDPDAGEFLFTAHLCHFDPGSNDNASGAASILEVARTIHRLVSSGEIAPLRQTIRFIWVPEMSGSFAFTATHPDIVEKMRCGINMDMVGSYLNAINTTYYFRQTPHSMPHFINDVVANVADYVGNTNVERDYYSNYQFPRPIISTQGSRDSFRYEIVPFKGGSDHRIYNDRLINVPMVFFNVWPDPYYESNQDMPGKIDPTTLKRGAVVAIASGIYTARAEGKHGIELASEVYTRGMGRLSGDLKKAFDSLNQSDKDDLHLAYKEADNVVRWAVTREKKAVASVLSLEPNDSVLSHYLAELHNLLDSKRKEAVREVAVLYRTLCRKNNLKPVEITLTKEEAAADKIIPVRNEKLKGPLGTAYLRQKLDSQSMAAVSRLFRDERLVYEAFNFIDGENSVLDIRNAVSAEYEPVPLNEIQDFLRALAKAEVVKMTNSQVTATQKTRREMP